MRTFLINVCRFTVIGVVLYGTFEPSNGIMFRGIGMSLALGLVGLGLCLDARQRALHASAVAAQANQESRA